MDRISETKTAREGLSPSVLKARREVIVTGTQTKQGRGVHFCSDLLLSGANHNLWFPIGDSEDWFTGIERILVMNGLAVNVVSLTPLDVSLAYTDWRVTFNHQEII